MSDKEDDVVEIGARRSARTIFPTTVLSKVSYAVKTRVGLHRLSLAQPSSVLHILPKMSRQLKYLSWRDADILDPKKIQSVCEAIKWTFHLDLGLNGPVKSPVNIFVLANTLSPTSF
jgi:hypothetical protein